jgi:very-short-patch-repair endonuclease
MCVKCARVDAMAAEIASKQHGVVSAAQLIAAGINRHAIQHRARTGRLHRVHHGVYAVGHAALSPQGQWMAAILACGRLRLEGEQEDKEEKDRPEGRSEHGLSTVLDRWGAALSYLSAARLWKLLPLRDGPIDVSVPGHGGKRRRMTIRLHRSLTLLPASVTLRSGIPVTTPARTISDLRRVSSGKTRLISSRELRRAIRQAGVLGLPIGDDFARDRTRSDLEGDFLDLCRRHRLAAPEVNVRVGPHLVDFLWRDQMLVVETDGYIYHRGRAAFEDDHATDLSLRGLGYDVMHIADTQMDEEPELIADLLRARLALSRSHSPEARHPAP